MIILNITFLFICVFPLFHHCVCSDFWQILNDTKPLLIDEGIELVGMIRNENPLNVWLPDLFMTTGKDITYLDETIRLHPGGVMFWSRHVVATLQQNQFGESCAVSFLVLEMCMLIFSVCLGALEYQKYPEDKQVINIGVESFAFKNNLVQLAFTPLCTTPEGKEMQCTFTVDGFTMMLQPPVTVIDSASTGGGVFNPLWSYLSNDYYLTPTIPPPPPYFQRTVVELRVRRESAGIVYRLAFPIMLLILLVGLSFWGEVSSRVEITITILLAVSALYIVIFSSIPMLGYLTGENPTPPHCPFVHSPHLSVCSPVLCCNVAFLSSMLFDCSV